MKDWLQRQGGILSAFRRALPEPEQAQAEVLSRYLRRNEETRFGKEHGFEAIRTVQEFQQAVPIRNYEGYEAFVAAIARGEEAVLTRDPVFGFEETSGSSGKAKLIPYTVGLQREFERSLVCWLSSIGEHHPGALAGKSYWSLSPPVKKGWQTEGGIPVGLGSDLAYFPEQTGRVLAESMAVSPELGQGDDAETFWDETVRQLLACEDLSLVSVWSPVFFLKLDEHLRDQTGSQAAWSEIWPQLKLLSCWMDAQSASWIPQVRARAGAVDLEGKGLLSTEGVVSIPWGEEPVLAVTSHFLEFLSVGGEIRLASELEEGHRYEVILTTGGGLYRYRTGDRIRVTGFAGRTPRVRFCGRSGRVSDLVGEKVSEEEAIRAGGGKVRFLAATPAGYLAVGEGRDPAVSEVEAGLGDNPYYQQAVDLGQLQPMRGMRLEPGQSQVLLDYFSRKQGCGLGDAKIPGLILAEEWAELEGQLRWESV